MKENTEEMIKRVKKIQAVVFDWDGVFTDNCEYLGLQDGSNIKIRSYYDGQGVSNLRAIGIRVAVVTNEKEKSAKMVTDLVNKWNNLPSSKNGEKMNGWEQVKLFTGMGGSKKVSALKLFIAETGIPTGNFAAMCDDLVDIELMRAVGFTAAPASAEKVIRERSDYVSDRPGGRGAVRDFTNYILAARGIDPTTLSPQ